MSTNKVNLGMQPGFTFLDAAKKEINNWGKTDLYSTGDAVIDEYLGGGFGRKDGYEIITIFGGTGMNKSTFATSIILDAAKKGTTIAYFALEDDPKDVTKRILIQCEMNEELALKILDNILFMPESKGYTLPEMSEAIEKIFKIADIVVVDPLQFIFEASEVGKGESEFNRQRTFMRDMNTVMKHTNKTLIIVSHTNKGDGKQAKIGLDKIIGSSAVAQVSTKAIEIGRDSEGLQHIQLWKNRFSYYRFSPIQVELDNMKIRTNYTQEDMKQLRLQW